MIQDPDSIDLMGQRRDGGVDLVIVSSGALDESPETQKLLLDKIEAYLRYINSPDFHREFPQATPENTRILLRLEEEASPIILALIQQIIPWVQEYHAKFLAQVKEGPQP